MEKLEQLKKNVFDAVEVDSIINEPCVDPDTVKPQLQGESQRIDSLLKDTTTTFDVEAIILWLEGYINYEERKIKKMKTVVPEHRNITRFEGELSMAKKTLAKIMSLINV